jgi:uncharacterized membrane protein YedE/YeeE
MGLRFLLSGAVFGFLLSRGRLTDYDTMMGMFRLTDLHVMGVMGVAIPVAAIGLFLLRRGRVRAATGGEIEVHPKPDHRWTPVAGLVFGAGWALTGVCPGTSLAQIGEGKTYALITALGIIAGTYAYGWLRSAPAEHRAEALAGAVAKE